MLTHLLSHYLQEMETLLCDPDVKRPPGRPCECMAEQKLNVCSSSLSRVPLPKRWPVAVADPFSSCSFTRTEILLPAKNCSVKHLLSPLQFLCHFRVSRELGDLLLLWLSLLWNAAESVFSFLETETHIMCILTPLKSSHFWVSVSHVLPTWGCI